MLLLPEDHENVKQFQFETRARRRTPLGNAEQPILDLEKEVAKVRGVGEDARHIGSAQRILAYADSCRGRGVREAGMASSTPVALARNTRTKPGKKRQDNSLRSNRGSSNAVEDSISAFFRDAASRPYGLRARAPPRAATGQATAVELQTNK